MPDWICAVKLGTSKQSGFFNEVQEPQIVGRHDQLLAAFKNAIGRLAANIDNRALEQLVAPLVVARELDADLLRAIARWREDEDVGAR